MQLLAAQWGKNQLELGLPNGGPHFAQYDHLVFASFWQPSQILDQGAGLPFYQGCVFDGVPYLRSAIITEVRQGYHFSLEYIPPWQRNTFRPNTLLKYQGQHLACGDLQIKNQLTVQIFQWYSLLVQLKLSRFASNEWFPGTLILSVAVEEKATHFQWRHTHEINSIDSVAGHEQQINGKFQLLEDWRIQIEVVSSCKAYMTIIVQVSAGYDTSSYVNRHPAYLDDISMPAVPINFHLSAKKLHSTWMLRGAGDDRLLPDNKDRQGSGWCFSSHCLGTSKFLPGR